MPDTRDKIFTVSQINRLIKKLLEEGLPAKIAVAGEITGWKRHHSGHRYFSVKDDRAILPCIMWKSNHQRVKFEAENGLEIIAVGFINVYPPQGRYQFYVETMQPKGVGALQLAFEQMRKRLRQEGLFKDEHKKSLPEFPRRIGILTSESGAAVGDIIQSVQQRWPCTKLFLYPVPVQGKGAAQKIAEAVGEVNRRNEQLRLDLLIVGRGGGSLEDLWAFNEEVLARAIFASQIPVISAVGHEYDMTIADLVADKRASTPTKAGVAAVPDINEIMERLNAAENRLHSAVMHCLNISVKELEKIQAAAVFTRPIFRIREQAQVIDDFENQLLLLSKKRLEAALENIRQKEELIRQIEPHRLLKSKAIGLANLTGRALAAAKAAVHRGQMRLTAAENLLAGLNPKAVLRRGYSISKNKKTGMLVKSVNDIEIGDILLTELAQENVIESTVANKQNKAD